MPGTSPGPSIKAPKVYEALRRQGMSKARAARISNAQAQKDDGASLHGPGGLLSTPGMGARHRRKGRKWGVKLKDKQIVGNLYRSDTGRFTAGSGPSSDAPPNFGKAPKKPRKGKRTPKVPQTPAQRAQARSQQRQTNIDDVAKRMAATDTGLGPSGSRALSAFAQGQQPDKAIGDAFVKGGLAEQGADGAYRMTPTGRAVINAMAAGDYQRAIDGLSRASDTVGKRTERQTAATQRRADTAKRQQDAAGKRVTAQAGRELARRQRAEQAKKPSGGSKKPEQEAAQKPLTVKPTKRPTRSSAPSAPASGGSSAPKPKPAEAKPSKEQAVASNRGAVRQAMAEADAGLSPSGFDSLMALGSGKIDARSEGLVDFGLAERGSDGTLRLTTGGRQAIAAADRGDAKAAIDAISRASEPKKAKSFAVFKDHTGQQRWIARTTTAYRDRDNEIISEAALDQDSQRMTASRQFGPLRYWHIGQPDPFDQDAPWGPGVDIGDCDYSVVIGRTRIESGTFRDPVIAQKVARQADQYELSPGFFHPLDQPGADGVFNAVRSFERSIVPIKYGRASNLFTGLAVKEQRMDIDEMEKRFKTAISDLGLDAQQAAALGQQLIATEKTATAQGIAFKSDENAPEDITINGVVYTVKAAAPPMEEMIEEQADEPIEAIAEEVIEPEAEEMAGDYLGDMSWDEFAAKLGELLAPVLKMQEMVKAMGDAHQELKTMYGGVAQKDDARAQEIATLKASLKDLTEKLAQIEGDQPATILPDEVAAALKSDGPTQAQEPERVAITQAINDPTRPFAGWGIQTFPELYKNGENS